MSPEFDIVIPSSYKDAWFLRTTIPFIREMLPADGTVYVILPKICFPEFSRSFLDRYGVSLLDEDRLLDGLAFHRIRDYFASLGKVEQAGWYFQQMLKIGFSMSLYARRYFLLWDSDTIPLHHLTFFDHGHIFFNPKKEHHPPYFKTIEVLLGIHEFPSYSFISEHMMVDSELMRRMVGAFHGDGEWFFRILKACDFSENNTFSEFETYGNFCHQSCPGLYVPRPLTTIRSAGRLFGRSLSRRDLQLLSYDFDTASFERNQLPPFPRNLPSAWFRFISEVKYHFRSS